MGTGWRPECRQPIRPEASSRHIRPRDGLRTTSIRRHPVITLSMTIITASTWIYQALLASPPQLYSATPIITPRHSVHTFSLVKRANHHFLLFFKMRPAINAAARTIQRRPFSLAQSLRAMGRAIEVHPIQRMQQRSWHAPADWGKQMRRLTTQVAM